METEGFFTSFLLLLLLLFILKQKTCRVCSLLQELPANTEELLEGSGSRYLRTKPFRKVHINRGTSQQEPLLRSLEMKDRRLKLQNLKKKKIGGEYWEEKKTQNMSLQNFDNVHRIIPWNPDPLNLKVFTSYALVHLAIDQKIFTFLMLLRWVKHGKLSTTSS